MGYEKEKRNESRKKSGSTSKQRQDWQGFVNITLSQADQETIGTAELLGDDFVGLLAQLQDLGYKVSFSPDTEHHCVICTATGVEDACLNVGYSLSGRGPDIQAALAVLWYKHSVLAQGGLWSNVGTSRAGNLYG